MAKISRGMQQTLDAHILVAEADPLAATFLRALIGRDTPLTTCCVDNAELGTKLLRRAAAGQGGRIPVAVITDMNLKDAQSDTLIGWIRTSAVTAQIPVLAMSADESPSVRQRALDAGATAFIGKSQVLKRLTSWLESVVAFSQVRDLDAKPVEAKEAQGVASPPSASLCDAAADKQPA